MLKLALLTLSARVTKSRQTPKLTSSLSAFGSLASTIGSNENESTPNNCVSHPTDDHRYWPRRARRGDRRQRYHRSDPMRGRYVRQCSDRARLPRLVVISYRAAPQRCCVEACYRRPQSLGC